MKTFVMIPTYNEKENIKALIDKILSLKIKNLHIVVADDNSPDGNVWEWTCSEYSPHYNGNEEKCSLDFFQNNAVRGGSWGSKQRGVRASNRNVIYGGYGPSDADSHRGFRLARENR